MNMHIIIIVIIIIIVCELVLYFYGISKFTVYKIVGILFCVFIDRGMNMLYNISIKD